MQPDNLTRKKSLDSDGRNEEGIAMGRLLVMRIPRSAPTCGGIYPLCIRDISFTAMCTCPTSFSILPDLPQAEPSRLYPERRT